MIKHLRMLRASNIRREVNDRVIVTDISFQVKIGEILFVRGPSGSGKTLLLRSIAYLDPIQVSPNFLMLTKVCL